MFCKKDRVFETCLRGSPCRSPVVPNAKIFLTNVFKIEALANLLATSNINKRFLKDLKLNITNMGQVGWMHMSLFITGNRGGVSSVESDNDVNLLI